LDIDEDAMDGDLVARLIGSLTQEQMRGREEFLGGCVYINAVVLTPEISNVFRHRIFLQAALSSISTM
jgi:hypothetical protein